MGNNDGQPTMGNKERKEEIVTRWEIGWWRIATIQFPNDFVFDLKWGGVALSAQLSTGKEK
jgi:hypothetical protein